MFKSCLNYHYHQLDELEKRAYQKLVAAYRNMEPETFLEGFFRIDRVLKVIEYVYNDNPEFFFVENTKIQYRQRFGGIQVVHNYRYSKQKKAQYERLILWETKEFLSKWIRPNMSTYEKLLAINGYLAANVTYDQAVKLALKEETGEAVGCCEDYSIVGPLTKHMGVCHGVAMTAKYLCDVLGIQCMVVMGTVHGKEKHAWNIIYSGKKDRHFYHWDPTYHLDLKGEKELQLGYFLISDQIIQKSRTWDRNFYPACVWNDMDYFQGKRMLIYNKDEVENYILERLKRDELSIAFRYKDDEVPSKETLEAPVREALKRYEKRFGFMKKKIKTINWTIQSESGVVHLVFQT